MPESPFDRFPPSFKPLFEKLPPPDQNGATALEGHWWRRDRDEIARLIAGLGCRLQRIERGLQKARDADDRAAVRGGVTLALVEMQEALLRVYGADTLWPLDIAIEALEYAGRDKRHWLTALSWDELHIRQDAPNRLILQAMAAAAIEYFEPLLNGTQKEIAASIAKAMGNGGFKPPSARTIQDWRNQFQPGKRRGRRTPPPEARRIYEAILGELQKAGSDPSRRAQPPTALFDKWLSEISERCRNTKEIPAAK